jgi:hypothetical protein
MFTLTVDHFLYAEPTNYETQHQRIPLNQCIVAKVLGIHAERLDREDELVVRIRDHTVHNVSHHS